MKVLAWVRLFWKHVWTTKYNTAIAPAGEQHVEMSPGVTVIRRNSGSLVHCIDCKQCATGAIYCVLGIWSLELWM